ncbi:MAG: NADH:flavin oxidoreductase [Desulfotomaculaceae bacterium]|nr:NADH:flavin oxidoreductase [Desulfotomaculaceae bacterium]
MNRMFEKTEIKGVVLKNRFVRSATYEGMATDDGAATPRLIETMSDLAKGGVGLIITGHAYVLEEGKAGPWQLGAHRDDLIPGLQDMTDAVHRCGGKIMMQLSHAGRFAFKHTPAVVSDQGEPGAPKAKEIDADGISRIVSAFASAARRAKESGFDGVQIHCAHGYLLNQFLSPAFNQRRDNYGGSIENRTRIHVEIIRAVREAVGEDYPVIIKLNGQDFIDNGLSIEDSLQAGEIMARAGIDAIELSGGLISGPMVPSRVGIKNEEDEAYFQEQAREFKKRIDIPLILVGGIRSFQVAERLVESGTADYISLCRPLIREPNLINRWESGDLRRALCMSDNRCFKTAFSGNGVSCAAVKDKKVNIN